MRSNWNATPGNIAFSTSPKSHIGFVKKKKMRSPWLATTWIIAFCIKQIAISASPVSENKLRMPFETLKHRFFHFIQNVFWVSPQVQNKLRVPGEPLKHPFFDLTEVTFWDVQDAENELKVSCDPLKHRFLDFKNFAFWVGQEEENEFPVPCEHLIYRFLDLTKVEFWALQEVENDFRCTRPIPSLLYRLKKSHFWLVE